MAIIQGEILKLNPSEPRADHVGAGVVMVQSSQIIATGEVGADDTFDLEVPSELTGEAEIRVATHGVAPATVTLSGHDMTITMIYNNAVQYG